MTTVRTLLALRPTTLRATWDCVLGWSPQWEGEL